ncbi:MAG: hypothetical protein NVS4B7_09420 [Ktedonobacteraceae bacterium]
MPSTSKVVPVVIFAFGSPTSVIKLLSAVAVAAADETVLGVEFEVELGDEDVEADVLLPQAVSSVKAISPTSTMQYDFRLKRDKTMCEYPP